jgi:phosphoribosylamine--glycine ligase
MKILVIGSGGREHAIGLKLAESPRGVSLVFAPGNPGMAALGTCVPVAADDVDGLVALAQAEQAELVVVGPEVPLVLGLADRLRDIKIPVFGPSAAAARLEGSKAFSKDIMAKYNVPTAAYGNFTELQAALDFIHAHGAPIVVKASGLAAGKGAIVCMELQEALAATTDMLGEKAVFGESGKTVVIEEFMDGEEASVFAVCDGENYVLLATAQDHKRIGENDAGPNTGGMGAYAPAPVVSPEILEQIRSTIIEPTLAGMKAEGCAYQGVLFVGIMVTAQGPKVVEYNCRLGDPECQVVLPLFAGDFVELLERASRLGGLAGYEPVQGQGACAVVVLASKGYPDAYPKGDVIHFGPIPEGSQVVHAGTSFKDDQIVSSGGRVLGAVGHGENLKIALERAYGAADACVWDNKYLRRDIGQKGLKRLGL